MAAGSGPAIDWLVSFQPGAAGVRPLPRAPQIGRNRPRPGPTVSLTAAVAGLVGSSPGRPLDPGRYRVVLELFPGPHPLALSPLDQAVVVEVLLDGYVLGYGTATFEDIALGPITVDFAVPTDLEQVALTIGVELRLISRGSVSGELGAILIQRVASSSEEAGPMVELSEWLAAMGTGEAGHRAGTEVNSIPGRPGVVLQGPHWRLRPGTYEVRLRARPIDLPLAPAESSPVATLEAVAGDRQLGHAVLSSAALSGDVVSFRFEIGSDREGTDDRVNLTLVTNSRVAFAVEALSVERLSPGEVSGAGDDPPRHGKAG